MPQHQYVYQSKYMQDKDVRFPHQPMSFNPGTRNGSNHQTSVNETTTNNRNTYREQHVSMLDLKKPVVQSQTIAGSSFDKDKRDRDQESEEHANF